MSYLVLARKWRPKTFSEVVGQSTVTRTLQNALRTGRVHAHAIILAQASNAPLIAAQGQGNGEI